MQKDSRRFALRERTAKAHEALDSLIGAFDSDRAYHRYLTGMAAFRLAVEPTLVPQSSTPDGYRPTMIGAEIRADLSSLGLDVPEPVAFSAGPTADAALGMLYVLEGSALGAQLLVRRAAALGFDADRGAGHLVRQTASLGGWRDYLARLDQAEPFDLEECADAALATFDAANAAFSMRSDH